MNRSDGPYGFPIRPPDELGFSVREPLKALLSVLFSEKYVADAVAFSIAGALFYRGITGSTMWLACPAPWWTAIFPTTVSVTVASFFPVFEFGNE